MIGKLLCLVGLHNWKIDYVDFEWTEQSCERPDCPANRFIDN